MYQISQAATTVLFPYGGGTGISQPTAGLLYSNGGNSPMTSTTSPTVGYLTSTSANATSTFAGNLMIGNRMFIGEKYASGTPTLGSELTDATGWTSTGWTGDYNAGFAHTAGNTTSLFRTMTVSNTSYYQISFTISGRTAGSVTVTLGSATTTQIYSTSNTYTVGHKPVTTNFPLAFNPTTDFNGTISAISVKVISAISTPLLVFHDAGGTAGVEFRQGTSSLQNTFIGSGSGQYNTTGNYNAGIGYNSLYSNTTGQSNTGVGVNALYSNTTGFQNTATGYYALYANTTGSYNTANGFIALRNNTTGSYNSASGIASMYINTTGSYNTAIGNASLYANTTGNYNMAIGNTSLFANTTGSYNVAYGSGTLFSNTTGEYNVGVGYTSMNTNTTGSNNIAIGFYAERYNNSATNTVAVGHQAARGTANYSSQGGTYLGYQAGYSAGTGGDYNTLLGYQSGYNVSTGKYNIILGQNVNATSSDSGAGLNIGNVLYGVGMYSGATVSSAPVQGSAIGVGSSSPLGKFSIQGFTNGTMPIATFATSSATNVYKTVFNIDKDGTLDTKYGIFCEMYSDNGAVTTSVPTGTTYTKINAFGSTTQAISTKYCTPTPASSILTITKPGKYRANVSVSFSSDPNINFKGALFVDGIERNNIHWGNIESGGNIDSVSASGFFTATSTSVVDFRVRHTDGGSNNFTVQYGNVNVEYIGE